MPYTVTDLITRAYYLSGVVSRDFETVSGPQFDEGLSSLNDVIDDKTSDKSMIPYFQVFNFPGIIGQETYFIANLIEVTSMVFFLNTVRYSMINVDRDAYFGLPRAETIQSLPFNYHVERVFGGANIYVYYLPEQNFPFQIWGKFRLAEVILGQDLSLTLDRFYIDYLKYALTERICDNYNYQVPANVAKNLLEYEIQIAKKSGILDLTIKKISTLDNNQYGVSYGQVNLGKGWTVS